MVTIYTRDTNGKQQTISLRWDDVCSYVETHLSELDEEEILMILYGNVCIYSQLGGHDTIGWEDVTGFFG